MKPFIIVAAVVGIVFTITLFVIGLGWLAMLVGLLAGYFLLLRRLSKIKTLPIRLIRPVLAFFGIVLLSVFIRVFLIEIYFIPTPSMENTVRVGDKVLVSKLKYGPRLPASPLNVPWLNLIFVFNQAMASDAQNVDWGYRRWAGYGRVERGDVVVFDHPTAHQAYIKRCVALPGDTLLIRQGTVYVNGERAVDHSELKMRYRVMMRRDEASRQWLAAQEINPNWNASNGWEAELTTSQVRALEASDLVFYMQAISTPKDFNHFAFPQRDEAYALGWSVDEYGPFVVPAKGMTVRLNVKNFNHYRTLIQERDGINQSLREVDGKYYLGDSAITAYTFQQNFYFMMGDNRHNSNDSRFWGPVQEQSIIGRAQTVLFSNDREGHFLNERTFLKIE